MLLLWGSICSLKADDFNPPSPSEPSARYQITTNGDPADGVLRLYGDGLYAIGENPLISITPQSDYVFLEWLLNGQPYATTMTFYYTVGDSSVNFTARFAQLRDITLSVSPRASGKVYGAGTFMETSECTVSTEPYPGWDFQYWTCNGIRCSSDPTYTFTVGNRDMNLVAVYAVSTTPIPPFDPDNPGEPEAYYFVNVTDNIGGDSTTLQGRGLYPDGSTTTISTLVPDGYSFSYWTLNGEYYSNSQTFLYTVSEGNVEFKAVFTKNSESGSGSGSGSGGGSGSGSGGGSGSGSGGGSGEIITPYDPANPKEPESKYIIRVAADPEAGAAKLTGAGSYSIGQQVTIAETAAAGYEFLNWTRDGVYFSQASSFSYPVGISNVSFVAHYAELHTVTVGCTPMGSGQVSNGGTWRTGSVIQVSTTPNPGYIFQYWTRNGQLYSQQTSFSYAIENEDAAFVAVYSTESSGTTDFEPGNPVEPTLHQIIRVYADPEEGASRLSGAGSYTSGAVVRITQTTAAGYHFVGWTESDTAYSSAASFYYTVAGDNMRFTAHYVPLQTVRVEVTPSGAGSATGGGTYPVGDTCHLSAVALGDYTFQYWTLNGKRFSKDSCLAYPVGDSAATFVAVFNRDTVIEVVPFEPGNPSEPSPAPTIKVTADPLSAASKLEGAGAYLPGRMAHISVTPDSAHCFDYWLLGDEKYTDSQSFDFIVGDTSVVFTAILVDKYCVTLSSIPENAAAVLNGEGCNKQGTIAHLTTTAKQGFIFDYWLLGDSICATTASYDYQMGDSSVNLTAHFHPVNSQDTTTFNPGNPPEPELAMVITAIPPEGNYFISWNDGDKTNPRTIWAKDSANYYPIFAPISFEVSDTIVICDNENYYLGNRRLNVSGVYHETLTNIYGGDSVVTLMLIVLPSYHIVVEGKIPNGGVYHFNGQDYSQSGTYNFELQTIAGCDSIIQLELTATDCSQETVYREESVTSCYSYTGPDGHVYTLSGDYADTLQTTYGCDSIHILHLTIAQPTTSLTETAICEGETFTWLGSAYTRSIDTTATILNAAGCDSVATLHLTVNPKLYTNVYDTTCANVPYVWNGQTYSAAGNYTFTTASLVTGCDSTTTLHLTVLQPSSSTTTVSICEGESFSWLGSAYTRSIDTTATILNAAGCDSVATLHLTVNSKLYQNVYDTICGNQPYVWNGESYTQTGNYTYTTSSLVTDCDSTTILHLVVKQPSSSETTATICEGETFTWLGSAYTRSIDTTATILNAAGCDSVATLHLTVNPKLYTNVYDTTCANHPYSWNGQTYSTSGNYTYTTSSLVTGCDSTTTLHLIVLQTSSSETIATIREGESFIWLGCAYTQSIDTTATIANAAGCDSVATLHLTVNSKLYHDVYDTICANQPYVWNGESYTQTGNYTYTTSSLVTDCDSTTILHLVVMQPSSSETTATICEGESFTWLGSAYTHSIDTTATILNAVGCDSVATLHLTVNSKLYQNVNDTTCANVPYVWNGQTYSAAGDYTFTTSSLITGCDSITTLHLTVLQPSSSVTTAIICEGETFTWLGSAYTHSIDTTATILNGAGCDSVATLHLTVLQPTSSTTTASICEGESFTWLGSAYTQSIDTTATILNAVGCDSVATLHLTVLPKLYQTVHDVTCANVPYVWNGQTYSAAGDYTFTTSSLVTGCDSITTLHLLVKQPTTSETTVSICEGESFSWLGSAYTRSIDTTATILNAAGCDSVATLHLTVNSKLYQNVYDTICGNQPYVWNGESYTQTGNYTYTTSSLVTDCDSTTILHLVVKQPSSSETSATICEGESFTWLGSAYTRSIDTTATILNAVGCDSVSTLHLIVNPKLYQNVYDTICGNQPYSWNGESYSTTGDYTYTTSSLVTGCDSITTLHLLVKQPTTSETTVSICEGETFTWLGSAYTHSIDTTATILNGAGCDSVATLHLTVLQPTSSTTTASICEGESFTWLGSAYTQSIDTTATILNAVGCDSVATLHLTVLPKLYQTVHDVTCANVPYVWNGQTYSAAGDYTFTTSSLVTGCDSTTTLHLTVLQPSSSTTTASICEGESFSWLGSAYTHSIDTTITFVNAVCCDSLVGLHLTVLPKLTTETNATVCQGETYSWNGQAYSAAGDYTFTTSSLVTGCDSTTTLHLTVLQPSSSETTATICEGETFTWLGHSYTQSIDTTATILNAAGCDSVATLHLTVLPRYEWTEVVTVDDAASYQWNGQTYTASGTYDLRLQTTDGCDSIGHLELTITYDPTILTELSLEDSVLCQGTTSLQYDYNHQACLPDSMYITFDAAGRKAGLQDQHFPMERQGTVQLAVPADIWPGQYTYTVTFTGKCDPYQKTGIIQVLYDAERVITQRWNDFLAVRQSAYDDYGGFSDYLWYIDGVAQTAETTSQLYLPDQRLSTNSTYAVEMTRLKDGVRSRSCDFIPTIQPETTTLKISPTIAHAAKREQIRISSSSEGRMQIFSANGSKIVDTELQSGDNLWTVPPVAGIYLIRCEVGDHEQYEQKIIVE